jgi:DNA polymerase IV
MQLQAQANSEPPNIMWIDLNSAFASAEQQAHPSLRGRPVGVTNRISPQCCVIAASYEAKKLGIKVGCRRSEALALCPNFILLETDPPKYHHVYRKLARIMKDYSPHVQMKSIDEGVIDFHGTTLQNATDKIIAVGHSIKQRVHDEIGDYIKINVGIGPNRFLAKTAASLHKPDGFDVIDHKNMKAVYGQLELQDLNGIAQGYGSRLRACGIFTPLDLLSASANVLHKQVFKSVQGLHWYKRIRGYEVDDYKTQLGMVGRQWVVKNPSNNDEYLRSCLHFLSETTAAKLRYRSAAARGVCVWLSFQAGGGFMDKKSYKTAVFSNQAIWLRALRLFEQRPRHMKVAVMGVYVYQIAPSPQSQLDIFQQTAREKYLTQAIDEINDRYGAFTIHAADTLTGVHTIKQKIPFGGTEYFELLLRN